MDHDPRVHLAIETDDVAAEVVRLEGLGAKRFRDCGNWMVIEAPTGHRFSVVRAHTYHFAAKATTWEGAA